MATRNQHLLRQTNIAVTYQTGYVPERVFLYNLPFTEREQKLKLSCEPVLTGKTVGDGDIHLTKIGVRSRPGDVQASCFSRGSSLSHHVPSEPNNETVHSEP